MADPTAREGYGHDDPARAGLFAQWGFDEPIRHICLDDFRSSDVGRDIAARGLDPGDSVHRLAYFAWRGITAV